MVDDAGLFMFAHTTPRTGTVSETFMFGRESMIVRVIVANALLVTLLQTPVCAEPATGPETYANIKAEYESATKARDEKMRAARGQSQDAVNAINADWKQMALSFAKRFLAIAEKDPKSSDGLDAAKMVIEISRLNREKGEMGHKAFALLREHHLDNPVITKDRFFQKLLLSQDPDGKAFINDLIAKSSSRLLQATAYQARAEVLSSTTSWANRIKSDDEEGARLRKASKPEQIKNVLEMAEKAEPELKEIEKILREKYSDIVNDLSIGATLPPIVGENLDGKSVSLDSLKGKVVVLDFWATWCFPCKAMIPHEREMVKRFQDKPFALISISVDKDKQTLVDFLAKESMPWTHWWNGPEGKLVDVLNVRHYPTIYVIDGKGVIRNKEIRNETLERAVKTLLDELEKKAA
jgi:thiol-disulfide isomerase/thioredoxin